MGLKLNEANVQKVFTNVQACLVLLFWMNLVNILVDDLHDSALFAYLISRTFSTKEQYFFSHSKSANNTFQLVFFSKANRQLQMIHL
jgi:hypothetical protein